MGPSLDVDGLRSAVMTTKYCSQELQPRTAAKKLPPQAGCVFPGIRSLSATIQRIDHFDHYDLQRHLIWLPLFMNEFCFEKSHRPRRNVYYAFALLGKALEVGEKKERKRHPVGFFCPHGDFCGIV